MNTWIDATYILPEKDQYVLAVVQTVRGGILRNERYLVIAEYKQTMTDKAYFKFSGEGIVTHWMNIPEMPNEMNKMLQYKGYYADYYLDKRDCIFYGTLYGIKDKVDFQCYKEDEIEKEFHKAVDDYLNFCKDIGKEPEKFCKGEN